MAKKKVHHPKRIKGNAKPFADLMPIENELKKGLAYANITKIRNYRDGVKDLTAKTLRKGLNKYNSELEFDFENFISDIYGFSFKSTKIDDRTREIKNFYSCFYDYFNHKTASGYTPSLSHYKRDKLQIIKRSMVDIKFYIDHNLLNIYKKLLKDYNTYKPSDTDGRLLSTINKLKDCYDIIDQICDIVNFLFFTGIPNDIPIENYEALKRLSCDVDRYYEVLETGQCIHIKNNITYISLGDKGAAFLYKLSKE